MKTKIPAVFSSGIFACVSLAVHSIDVKVKCRKIVHLIIFSLSSRLFLLNYLRGFCLTAVE